MCDKVSSRCWVLKWVEVKEENGQNERYDSRENNNNDNDRHWTS